MVKNSIFEDKRLELESRIMSTRYDDLTGLPAMSYFFELAEAGKTAMLEAGLSPVLIFLDMSGLKFFNQKFGFRQGNQLLKEFSVILGRLFSNENCGRFGQDHFAVYTHEEELEEKLTELFAECKKMNGGNSLSVRAGIYPYRIDPVDVSIACDRAKVACDELRGSYASGFKVYDRKLKEEVELRSHIIENIDKALDERWIKVFYQPIVRSSSGIVCDDEALSRWFDPERGILMPDLFVPVLEEAGLIYKLDLFVVDRVLEKMKRFRDKGIPMVPHSINLSRSDFETCDIVEEIRKRVDRSGIGREYISIEITESMVGKDFDFMKYQIERFRSSGFAVWIDDFGSGYSSLNLLQSARFDLIKFDMQFMKQFSEGEGSRVILTELMRMAASLGLDTVCEGVETEEQVAFLKEIGCSKLQGYYFRKASPGEEILKRYEDGCGIGYEDPARADYFKAIGLVNLNDIASVGVTDKDGHYSLFGGMPMAVIEVKGELMRFIRANGPYIQFVKKIFGYEINTGDQELRPVPTKAGKSFFSVLQKCSRDGERAYFNETMPNGSIIHAIFGRIAVDPVTERTAVAVSVISITDSNDVTTYESLVKVISADYINIFYVDLETDQYIEYSSIAGGEELNLERHGENFFEEAGNDARKRLYPEDCAMFADTFTREKILAGIEKEGSYSVTYRLKGKDGPFYANMNIAMDHQNGHHLIIGVRSVDTQMKQREALEDIRREQEVFSRIRALSGEYFGLYVIDPETDHYVQYSVSKEYERFGFAASGTDFFHRGRVDARKAVCSDDLPFYMLYFTKENVMKEIRENGIFVLNYSIVLDGIKIPSCLRIAMVEESDGKKLIAGLNRSNEQMLQEVRARERRSTDTSPCDKNGIDYQRFADVVHMPCCILSVEKSKEKRHGMIRIVRANSYYKRAMGPNYYDDMPYDELVPQDDTFEDFCYRAAILKQRMHAYVETRVYNSWIDETLIPLESDDEGKEYCQFIFELTEAAEVDRMASVSLQNAGKIIKASLKLLGSNDIKENAGAALEDIIEISEAARGRIMLIDHDNEEAVIFSERFSGDITPAMKKEIGRNPITYDLITTWEEAIGVNNNIIVRNEQEMFELEKESPIWVMSMRMQGIKSLLLFPLRNRKELIGYIYIVNFNIDKEVEIKELMELMAFYLASEISNHLLMQKLERISEVDSLTGINNRRAMANCVERMNEKTSFGVLNIDLNGLKTVNDKDGHEAGDRLLIKTAGLLRRVFRKDDIYRTGGDEFVIIADSLEQRLFMEKVERLKELSDNDPDVSLAMGECWSDGTMEVNTALRIADERMYADKKKYYELHSGKKR